MSDKVRVLNLEITFDYVRIFFNEEGSDIDVVKYTREELTEDDDAWYYVCRAVQIYYEDPNDILVFATEDITPDPDWRFISNKNTKQ